MFRFLRISSILIFSVAYLAIAIDPALGQWRGSERERDRETTKAPAWAPSFPGFGSGGRDGINSNSGSGRELGSDLDYFTTHERTSPTPKYPSDAPERETGWPSITPKYPDTTEVEYTAVPTGRHYPPPVITTTTSRPWYKRVGHYAKDKFNYVYNKITG